MKTQIKFNKYHVTNGEVKARVFYSLDNRGDKRPCVSMYEKDYNRPLRKIFPELYQNDSDMMTDYFENGRVNLFEEHPLYKTAREAVEKHKKIN